MAKSRMAGEALAARNRAARERKSNDPEQLASRVAKAKGAGYDLSGYSDKEISMALQGDKFGDEDYFRLTGKKADGGGDSGSGGSAAPEAPKAESPSNSIADNVVKDYISKKEDQSIGLPGFPSGGGDGMSQNVNQDNDITTSITGDGNTVNNEQDNSVDQGGYASRYARGLKNQYVLNLLGKE